MKIHASFTQLKYLNNFPNPGRKKKTWKAEVFFGEDKSKKATGIFLELQVLKKTKNKNARLTL